MKDVISDNGNGPYHHYDGSYNNGVNGFDGVFIKGTLDDPAEIIINESKQRTGNPVTLTGANGGNPAQMTDAWVEKVRLELLTTGDQEKINIARAIAKGLDPGNTHVILTKVVTVIDRTPSGNTDGLIGGINVVRVQ